MVVLFISSEKVALMLAVGATSVAFALGEVLVTLGGVVLGAVTKVEKEWSTFMSGKNSPGAFVRVSYDSPGQRLG
jgi:hypothetical protein